MKPLFRSLGFRLVGSSLALAFVTLAVWGIVVYKVSEDAIKVDSQLAVRQLTQEMVGLPDTGREGRDALVDLLASHKVERFGAAWVMDRNGFLIAHMDPKFRNMVEAQTYIGDTLVDLNVVEQPIQQLGEKNVVHHAKLQELIDRYDGGFGTYYFLGDRKILAFRVIKERGWLIGVDQPIATAYSELDRIRRGIVYTCLAISVLILAFTWFALRIIIRPYYREQEETAHTLELMNRELEASRKKLEKASNSLTRLYDISISMQYTGFLETHLPLVLGVAQERFEVDRILLLMPDEEGAFLRCKASVGNIFEADEKIHVPLGPGGGGLAKAYLEKRSIFFDGKTPLPPELRIAPPYDRIRSLRTRLFAVFPLVTKEKVIGVIGVDNKVSRRPMTREDLDAVENFAYKMASLIDNTMHLQAIRKTAQEMENRDRLTGLYRLRFARQQAEGYVAASLRDQVPFSAARIHLANFKEYNERNGYQRGDYVLQKTAEILRAQEVMGAIPARAYGAVFLVLYPGKNRDQSNYLVQQFLRDFKQFSFYGEKQLEEGKIVPAASVEEYPRDQGPTFDEFFASLEKK